MKGRLGWQGLTSDEYLSEGPHVISSAHFSDSRIRWGDCPRVSQERYERDVNIQVQDGDVLLMKDGAALGKLAQVREPPGPACVNSHLLLLRPLSRSASRRFLYYLLASKTFQEYMQVNGKGSTFLGVSQEAIGNFSLTMPPAPVQNVIADFLDRKTAAIDALIEKKERLLTLLAEKRAALIHHAVTKGLDPDVPMKDSGVPWIGEIPAHWEVVQLRRAVTAICDGPFGSSLASKHYSDTGVRVIRLQNIGSGAFRDDDAAYIPAGYFRKLLSHSARPGDLLIAGLGDDNHPLGRACTLPGFVSQALVKADCYRVRLDATWDHQYVASYFSSSGASFDFLTRSRGSTRARINLEVVRETMVPRPPAREQVAIVERLRTLDTRSDRLTDDIRAQLTRLREYRQALITAAVTGQIDVTGEESRR